MDVIKDLMGKTEKDKALFKLGQQRTQSLAEAVGVNLGVAHILLWPLEFLEKYHNRFMQIEMESVEMRKRVANLELHIEMLTGKTIREKVKEDDEEKEVSRDAVPPH